MTWPTVATKVNLDQASDDPKQARSELATLVDKFNQVQGQFTGVSISAETRAAIVTTSIESDVNIITTGGYTTAGDGGGALYKRVGSEPSHDLKIQSADGAWWEIVPDDDGVNVKQGGAVGDDTADDTVAIQDVFDAAHLLGYGIKFPPGEYKITTPITLEAGWDGVDIRGVGKVESVILPRGVSAFKFTENSYYRMHIHDLKLKGDSSAVAAFDSSPDTTGVFAGVEFYRLNISKFKYGWEMKNTMLCYFHDSEVNLVAGGAAFLINPPSGSAMQCNGNRVHRIRFTGGGGTIFETILLSSTEGTGGWKFNECEIQLGGTAIPFHVLGPGFTLVNSGFENSSADYLIHLESTGTGFSARHASIRSNVLSGGTVASIRSSQASGAGLVNSRCEIINNITTGVLLDLEDGQDFQIKNNGGSVNNTGGRFTLLEGGGTNVAKGRFIAINISGKNDTMGFVGGAISSSGTLGKNMAGTATFDTATTVAVAFDGSRAEPDANYMVLATGNVEETFWVTSKTTGGFTLNSSATSVAVVDWFIVR